MPSSTTHSAKSSSRTPDSQIEILYNTAVQSFVRRDHSTTQANLARLTKLLKTQLRSRNEAWYDLDAQVHKEDELESWIIKTLKLVISSLASLYTDPPSNTSRLPNELKALLPPSPPEDMLAHIHNTCAETYFSASSPEPRLLPPPLLSTLLLAALKLSLPFTHRFAEDWLALLPDAFIFAISPNSNVAQKAEKRVEAAREGYLKVVELFVSEVLAREEEWEMARGFLEGEAVMGSKRKEVGASSSRRFPIGIHSKVDVGREVELIPSDPLSSSPSSPNQTPLQPLLAGIFRHPFLFHRNRNFTFTETEWPLTVELQ